MHLNMTKEVTGAIIKVAGITGRIRGMKYKRADGRAVRPSLVILDDPQTDESARSASQCAERERILAGAVLGLARPGRKISGIMPCTVIRPDDIADRILNRDKHPQWQGESLKGNTEPISIIHSNLEKQVICGSWRAFCCDFFVVEHSTTH